MTGAQSERELRSQLLQLTLGYWRSQVLFAASELGVFEAIADAPKTAEVIASQTGTSSETMARLLGAACSLDLLEREGEAYKNSPLTDTFLCNGDRSMKHWVGFMADCYGPWGSLAEAVRKGTSVAGRIADSEIDKDSVRNMILAMRDYARGPGRAMAGVVDLKGRKRLLDVGGGPGTYSVLLAQKNPELSCVIYDLAPVAEIANELIAEEGLSDRVVAKARDYSTDEFDDGFDVVLLSNMLHQEDPEECKRILRKAHGALVPGGLLIVQLAFLNPQKDGPVWAALQSLQLQLFYEGGRAYSHQEILDMLEPCGFTNGKIQKVSLVSPESLVLATKAS